MSDGNIWCGECSAVVPFRNLDGGIGECVDCGSRFPIPATIDPRECEVSERIAEQVAELETAPMPEYTEENFQPCGLTEDHPSKDTFDKTFAAALVHGAFHPPKDSVEQAMCSGPPDEGIKEEFEPLEGIVALVHRLLTDYHIEQGGRITELGAKYEELQHDFDEFSQTVSLELLKLRPLRGGPTEPSPSMRTFDGADDFRRRGPRSGRGESGETVCGQSGKGARIPLPGGPYYEDEGVDHEHDPVPTPEQLHEACGQCGCPVPGTLGHRDQEYTAGDRGATGSLGDNHPYSS